VTPRRFPPPWSVEDIVTAQAIWPHLIKFEHLQRPSVNALLTSTPSGLVTILDRLFFVISAFSLTYAHDKSVGRDGWIGPYLIKRIFRIGPLFWAMMVAYLFLWWWPPRHFIELLIINATFAFNFFPRLHESIVAAGWSVGVEMPFYLAFPFILSRVRRPGGAVIFLVAHRDNQLCVTVLVSRQSSLRI
jgi:peptidoglycan/LPS O-acetylase OafA/YrhL